jgi:methanethiol S-methyltransferase
MKYLLVVLLWVGYCALHSYLISIRFTNIMTRLLKKYYAFYRLFYVLISLVLLIPLLNYTGQLDSQVIITDNPHLNILRYFLTYGSLLIFFWSFFFDYDSLSFSGIRQILNIGKSNDGSTGNEIKRKGLLGIIRHPMYFALIVYLWSQTHRLMDVVVYSVLTIYVIIGTLLEEKKLVLEFGEAYKKYQQEVPMIIPFTKVRSK